VATERDRVVFLRPDAERIARVVRAAENGNRDETPLRFGRVFEQRDPKVFRICTFTGSWNINASKTVTFKYATSTPNTASAINLFFPLPHNADGDCAIAKDGTAWYLIDVRFYTATAVFSRATATQTVVTSITTANFDAVSSINIEGSLNTSDCTITISQTANTQAISYVTGTAGMNITLFTDTFTSSFIRFEP